MRVARRSVAQGRSGCHFPHHLRIAKGYTGNRTCTLYAASQDRRVRSDTGPVDREGERPRSRMVDRRDGGERRRNIVRSLGKTRGHPNRKQNLYEYYRNLRQKEDEEFRKRYG